MINILIIDDDDDDSDLLRDAIQQICPGVKLHDGLILRRSLQRVCKTKKIPRPDFIFLDLNMPRVNGIQCLQQLKANLVLVKYPLPYTQRQNRTVIM